MTRQLTPRKTRTRQRRAASRRAGFSLVEVMISMTVVSVAMVGVMGSISSSSSLADANRETSVAYRAVQRTLEQIQGSSFEDVWALYNRDEGDDPLGVGSAPGANFDVAGLEAREDDPDGSVGRITFPISLGGGPSIVLLDDLDEPGFNLRTDRPTGLLRDYDDHVDVSDAAGIDPSQGYLLLPVRIQLEWSGASGDRSIAVETILAPQ